MLRTDAMPPEIERGLSVAPRELASLMDSGFACSTDHPAWATTSPFFATAAGGGCSADHPAWVTASPFEAAATGPHHAPEQEQPQPQQHNHPRPRELQQTRQPPLLGRPRASSFTQQHNVPATVRRKIFSGETSGAAFVVVPPADSLPRISTNASSARSSACSGTLRLDVTGFSSLTIAGSEIAGGAEEIEPTTATAPPPATAPAPPPYSDWRSAYRIPLFAADGKLMGYRQNSCVLAKQAQASQEAVVDTAADALSSPSPPDSPYGFDRGNSSPHAEDFAAAAASPTAGFPDADSRVPGYLLGPIIGRGGFCCVHKGLHIPTSLPVAIKVIDKQRVRDPKDRDRVDREMRVMRQLAGHVGIVQLLECAETPRHLYIIMEHCAGGSLLDYVRDRRKLPESEAAPLFRQLIAALQHCHRRGIVHRDVKLENVLLDGRGGVRLIDFGLCGYYLPHKTLRCHCGSPSYAAPEIVARRDYLAPPVDVWSAGVVLFAMLAGYLPFHAKDKKALSAKIAEGTWRPPAWFSLPATDLLGRMLSLDPQQRTTLEEVGRHPWLQKAEAEGGATRSPKTCGAEPDMVLVLAAASANASGGGEADVEGLLRALRLRECNARTAGYHLLCGARQASRRVASSSGNSGSTDGGGSSGGSSTVVVFD